MTFNIALNFEDGVTRFIQCNAGEKVPGCRLSPEGESADGLLGRRLRYLQMPLRQR